MNKASSLIASFIVLLFVTTLVLPRPNGTGSAPAVKAFFDLLSSTSKHLTGQE